MDVRKVRERLGLTHPSWSRQDAEANQEEFARLVKVDVVTLRRWETGRTAPRPYYVRLVEEAVAAAGTREVRS